MFPLLNHLVIVCRCCLLEQPPLYHNIYDNNLSAELQTLAPSLRLQSDDGLTDIICDLCLRRVRDALEFRQRCEEADRVLRQRHEQWCRTVAEGEVLALDDVLECLEREVGSLEQLPAPPETVDFDTLSFADHYSYMDFGNAELPGSSLNTPIHLPAALEFAAGSSYEANQVAMANTNSEASNYNNWSYMAIDAQQSPTVTTTTATTVKSKPKRTPRKSSPATRAPKSLHPCSECEKKFTRNFQLKLHMVSVHGLGDGLRYQCEVCRKTFASRHSLRYHCKSVHSTERPFPCPHCERRFVQRTQLVSHLRIHTGEAVPRIYACSKCNKTWPTMSDLRTHMRSHDPDMVRPFKCDRCSKAFFTRGHLSSHILVHTGEKPYGCDYCEKCYQSVGNLNNHMIRQHSDIIESQLQRSAVDIES